MFEATLYEYTHSKSVLRCGIGEKPSQFVRPYMVWYVHLSVSPFVLRSFRPSVTYNRKVGKMEPFEKIKVPKTIARIYIPKRQRLHRLFGLFGSV